MLCLVGLLASTKHMYPELSSWFTCVPLCQLLGPNTRALHVTPTRIRSRQPRLTNVRKGQQGPKIYRVFFGATFPSHLRRCQLVARFTHVFLLAGIRAQLDAQLDLAVLAHQLFLCLGAVDPLECTPRDGALLECPGERDTRKKRHEKNDGDFTSSSQKSLGGFSSARIQTSTPQKPGTVCRRGEREEVSFRTYFQTLDTR